MSSSSEDLNIAIFCDFENVALGVRDARIEKFNINLVLERLLVKGSVVVKKAYCDWERYKEFKAVMHDAAFELIESKREDSSNANHVLQEVKLGFVPIVLSTISNSVSIVEICVALGSIHEREEQHQRKW